MMASEVRAVFLESLKRTESVESFRFKPSRPLSFRPGQFAQITFDENNNNNRQLNKYLSFSCSPDNDYLEFTKRISESNFSQRLKTLRQGDSVLLKGPFGNCVFKEEHKRIGFLIGGIGITPVISILEYISQRELSTDTCLIYSNRTEADIAFRQEIDAWVKAKANIRAAYTVTDCKPQDAFCLFGSIDQRLLKNKVCGTEGRIFYIFGPPGMVMAMKRVCAKAGCGQEQLKTENFLGY